MKKHKVGKNGNIELTVYRRWVELPGSEYDGKSYVGVTDDIDKRNACFNKKVSNYAGKKMRAAMDAVPRSNWKLEVLEIVKIDDPKDYKAISDERETFYIAKFNSFENGLNGNRGGSGNKGVKFDEARCKQNGDNRRGKPQPPESVKRGADKRRGRKQSAETCKKKSEANTGKKRTPEMKARQSARMKGKNPVAATLAAKEWHKQNPGGYWGNHEITPQIRANMKAAQQAQGTRVKATLEDRTIQCFSTMLDCATHFGLGVGSISNFIKTGNFSKTAKAKFEKITDAEYQQWKSLNP